MRSETDPEGTSMFVVFSPDGDEEVRFEDCYSWEGIPSLAELFRRLNGASVTGISVEVELALPRERINMYSGSNGRTFGSYDGRTVVVSELGLGTDDSDSSWEYRALLEMVYKAVIELFFQIVHGQAKGHHEISPAVGQPGAQPFD